MTNERKNWNLNIILIISEVRRKVKKSCKGKKLKEKVKSIKEKTEVKKIVWKKSQKLPLYIFFNINHTHSLKIIILTLTITVIHYSNYF